MLKVFFKTFGCTLNQADTLLMMKYLSKDATPVVGESDIGEMKKGVVIVNTCAVKNATEQKILEYIKKLESSGVRMVVAGCLAQAYPELIRKYTRAPILGVDSLDKINLAISDALNNRPTMYLERKRLDRTSGVQTGVIAKLPISTGCLSNCTFCATKLARNILWSAKEEDIIAKIKELSSAGFREIELTGQDLGVYGKDIGSSLPKLMKMIGEEFPSPRFRIRIGMMNPQHVKEFIDELIDAYSYRVFYKFAHVPLQSGSDRILKLMQRNYTAEEFLEVCNKLKSNNIAISTDIIVGFPTETDDDFNKTLEAIKKVRPISTNLSKFSKRPGTLAAKLPQVDNKIMKERSVFANSFIKSMQLEENRKFIGRKIKVIVTEPGNGDKDTKGRTEDYRQVVLKNCEKIPDSSFIEAEVTGATVTSLIAKIV